MIVASILEAEDFGEELYPTMRNILTDLIKIRDAKVITAGGDSKGMIYRLFCEMAVEYPGVFFTILLSNDKLAYEDSDVPGQRIFSLDCDIAYKDPKNARERRNNILIDRSDIVICRKSFYNYVHSRVIGNDFKIIAV